MDNKLINIEKSIISIQVSLKWHKRLLLGLYGLIGVFLVSSVANGSINGAITGLSVLNNQEVINMDWSIFQPLLIVLAALIRSIMGWAKVSFADGFIQDFEIKKLGETIFRVGLIGAVVIYFPLSQQYLSIVEMGAVTIAGDLLLSAVKKRRAVPAA